MKLNAAPANFKKRGPDLCLIMASTGERAALLPDARSSQSTAMPSATSNTGEGDALSTTDPQQTRCFNEAMSKLVNRKMDIALLPFLSLLYLFNGLGKDSTFDQVIP